MVGGEALREQRARYGDANVDKVLLREKELWARKEEAAAKALAALP
jgi:hypothetical protein